MEVIIQLWKQLQIVDAPRWWKSDLPNGSCSFVHRVGCGRRRLFLDCKRLAASSLWPSPGVMMRLASRYSICWARPGRSDPSRLCIVLENGRGMCYFCKRILTRRWFMKPSHISSSVVIYYDDGWNMISAATIQWWFEESGFLLRRVTYAMRRKQSSNHHRRSSRPTDS